MCLPRTCKPRAVPSLFVTELPLILASAVLHVIASFSTFSLFRNQTKLSRTRKLKAELACQVFAREGLVSENS